MATLLHSVETDSNSSLTFTLKENAVNIFEEPQNNLWTYDLEGRLLGMFVNGLSFRRTLNNKFYLKSRVERNNTIFRKVNMVTKESVIPLADQCHNLIELNIHKLPIAFRHPLNKILKMDFENLAKDARTFSEIYLPISILPPDQYMSLVLQLTEGCNYNQCTFCNFYKDRPFKIKSIEEFESHIKQIKEYFGEGLKLRKSVFLADANAISTPQDRLLKSLELIQKYFPIINNIFSFVDVFTGMKKSVKDFKNLNFLGLKRVYLGIESGNNDLMSFLNKKQLNTHIIELTNTIKQAGINVGVIFLVGAGGEHFAQKHMDDSINLIQNLPLAEGDIIYLSELYDSNSVYIKSMNNMNYIIPTQLQIREWSNTLKKEVKNSIVKEIQVSIYDINQFFY